MKLFLKFLIFVMVFSGNLYAQEKRAMVIAIGDYPEESGWTKISAQNDVPLITGALTSQGFKNENILVLQNEQATKEGIIDGFNVITERVGKGDVVFIHFSGHGQQIMDDNGDEIDGYDESLIPYDASMIYETSDEKSEKHLRDDDLGALLDKIRNKIGSEGDLIVTLDACHSGTATRGIGRSRGTTIKFAPKDYNPSNNQAQYLKKSFLETANGANLSPIIVISGSSASEQNYEYSDNQLSYGSLSYALSRIVSEANPSMTYRGIFGKVQNIMSAIAPRQNPQIEGDADRKLFAGKAVEQKKFTTVKYHKNENTIVIAAGKLNGITNNCRVELQNIGTNNPQESEVIVKGTVVNAQLNESLVILDSSIEKKAALNSWVFISSYAFEQVALSIKMDEGVPKVIADSLNSRLRKLHSLSFSQMNPDLLISMGDGNKDEINVYTKDDQELVRIEVKDENVSKVVDLIDLEINRYAQAQLLRKTAASNTRIKIGIELIPLQLNSQFQEESRNTMEDFRNGSGQYVFRGGDYFKIKLTNTGTRLAYYTLLSIQSDNVVNILIPEKYPNGDLYRAAADCKIEAGATEELDAVFYFGEPYGQEVFKLIASSRPLNLVQLGESRGQSMDISSLNPFELLFMESNMPTRSNVNYQLPPEFINIETLVFEVRPE